MTQEIELSIVATMYKSAPYLRDFCERVSSAAETVVSGQYEIILLNDGCPDGSLEQAVGLQDRFPMLRVVDLSRNFGHHKAMMTALSFVRGQKIFLIDCDLEEPPDSLIYLSQIMAENPDADVVFGVQRKIRNAPFLNRITGTLYYSFFNLLSTHRIERDQLTARLMTRRYVEALLLHKEHYFNIEGLWHIAGFKQVPVTIEKSNFKGVSSYTLKKKIVYLFSAITAFSSLPLIYIAILGFVMTIASALFGVFLLVQFFFFELVIEGWTSLMLSLWFLSSLIIFALGVISTYLAVIFNEIKARPYSIVKDVYDSREGMTDRRKL